jgi:hypothetical protein
MVHVKRHNSDIADAEWSLYYNIPVCCGRVGLSVEGGLVAGCKLLDDDPL